MKKSMRVLIKLGGATLDAPTTLANVTLAIERYRAVGYQVILVHGGGPAINSELVKRGITWTFVNGQRVTTPMMMEVIESVLCGQVNSHLVKQFVGRGLPAIGLADPEHRTLLCSAAAPELGLVGQIQKVNVKRINAILRRANAPVPVIAPVGIGLLGQAYNVNADVVASHLAVALKADQLIFLTDQTGMIDEEGELVTAVKVEGLENMIEHRVVSGGMLTKTRAVIHALKNGIGTVKVMNAEAAAMDLSTVGNGTECSLNFAEEATNVAV